MLPLPPRTLPRKPPSACSAPENCHSPAASASAAASIKHPEQRAVKGLGTNFFAERRHPESSAFPQRQFPFRAVLSLNRRQTVFSFPHIPNTTCREQGFFLKPPARYVGIFPLLRPGDPENRQFHALSRASLCSARGCGIPF